MVDRVQGTSGPACTPLKRRLSAPERRSVLERFAGRCFLCLRSVAERGHLARLPRDLRTEEAHYWAWSQGGPSSPENVFPLCASHHTTFDRTQQSRLGYFLRRWMDSSPPETPLKEALRIAIETSAPRSPDPALRMEIWREKARRPGGATLLAQEGGLLLAEGQAVEAWEGARRLLQLVGNDQDFELGSAFSLAARAAQVFGDLELAEALTLESIAYIRRSSLPPDFKLRMLARRVCNLANHLFTMSRQPAEFTVFGGLDELLREVRSAGPAFADERTHIEAFVALRELGRWQLRPSKSRGSGARLVEAVTTIAGQTHDERGMNRVRREINIGHALVTVGSHAEAAERFEVGANRLREFGDSWNAALT